MQLVTSSSERYASLQTAHLNCKPSCLRKPQDMAYGRGPWGLDIRASGRWIIGYEKPHSTEMRSPEFFGFCSLNFRTCTTLRMGDSYHTNPSGRSLTLIATRNLNIQAVNLRGDFQTLILLIHSQQNKIEDESNSVGPDDVQKLLQSIRLAISILYKLPLRRPAPMDRLRYGTIGEGSWSDGPDVTYIKDKFPNSRLPENVMIRLGKAMTKRRQLLSYRRNHREKLKNAAGWADDASQPGSQAMTKATTLHSDQMIPLQEVYESAPSVADSAKTSIAASQATQEISLEVPPRPLDKWGQSATTFQCNYCQLTVHFASDSSWRRHVLGDLQPFVCTFSECNLDDGHLFDTEKDWFDHEVKVHRFEYFCNTTGHQKYGQATGLQEHLKLDHSLDTETLQLSLSVFKYPKGLAGGTCDFCLAPSNNLKRHVSRHLRQLALFAIPRDDYTMEDEDAAEERGSSSKNAAASTQEDETTDMSSRAHSNTSESASGIEGQDLLARQNDADEGIEDSTGLLRLGPSPGNNLGDIEESLSSLSLESDLAQSHIDGSGGIDTDMSEQGLLLKGEMDHLFESSRRSSGDSGFKGLIPPETGPLNTETPEIPSDAALEYETNKDAGKREKLPSIPEVYDIADASISSEKSSEQKSKDKKGDHTKYRRNVSFEPVHGGARSSQGSFPQDYSSSDRSAQAYYDLHKAHLSLKDEYAKLREELRDINARYTAIVNTIKDLGDDKEKLVREKRTLWDENYKLRDELQTLSKSAGNSAQAPIEGSI
ncbi:hypothetical protein K456DRAFT_951691 [Colletotrichum gloeosporioides 23]|nr:hypothetical protein K456DRAFT_951691 [Colletotrichum gloeosporioides 23]